MPVTSDYLATAEGTNAWTSPTEARTDNATGATAVPAKNSSVAGIWKTYGITQPASSYKPDKVEVGLDWYISATNNYVSFNIEVSYNGGTNWTTPVACDNTTTKGHIAAFGDKHYFDVTSGRTWTWSELNDTNFQVRITAVKGNSSTSITFYLDCIPVRITYGYSYSVDDTMAFADAITKMVQISITDTMGLADALLSHKAIPITDTQAFADALSTPTRSILPSDTMGFSDSPLVHKAIVMTDSLGLVEVTGTPTKDLLPEDTMNLLDAIVVDKGSILKSEDDAFTLSDELLIDKLILILDSISHTDDISGEFGTPPVVEEPPPQQSMGRIKGRRKTVKPKKGKGAKLLPQHIVVEDVIGFTDAILASIADFLMDDTIRIEDARIAVHKQLSIVDSFMLHDTVRAHRTIILTEMVTMAEQVQLDITKFVLAKEDEIVLVLQARAVQAARELRFMLATSRTSVAKKLRVEGMKDPAMMNKAMAAYEKDLVSLFKDFKKSLPKALDLLGKAMNTKDLASKDEEELASLVNILINNPAKAKVSNRVKTSYNSGAKRADQFLKGVGVSASFNPMSADAKAIQLLEQRNLAYLDGITKDMSADIVDDLKQGMLEGKNPRDIAKVIDEDVELGITRARVLARTETMFAFNEGLVGEYEEHGIEAVEWLAAYDDRVCEFCGPYMGKKFPIDEAPDCPLHPQCRCTLLPVIGTQETEPGPTPAPEPEPMPTPPEPAEEYPPGVHISAQEMKPGIMVGDHNLGISNDYIAHAPTQEAMLENLLINHDPGIRKSGAPPLQIDVENYQDAHDAHPTVDTSTNGYWPHPPGHKIIVIAEYLKDYERENQLGQSLIREPEKHPYILYRSDDETDEKYLERVRKYGIEQIGRSFEVNFHEYGHELDLGGNLIASAEKRFDDTADKWTEEFEEYSKAYKKAKAEKDSEGDDDASVKDFMDEKNARTYDAMGSHPWYATTKEKEFWAVSFSMYCSRPWKLKAARPDLYEEIKYRIKGWESPLLEWYEDGEIPEDELWS